MKIGQYSWILLIACLFYVGGCQESDSQLVRKAKLVGHENLQLKKQIEEKDSEIKTLEQKIADMEQDFQQQLTDSGESSFKLLEMVAESNNQLEACKAENEKLKQSFPQ